MRVCIRVRVDMLCRDALTYACTGYRVHAPAEEDDDELGRVPYSQMSGGGGGGGARSNNGDDSGTAIHKPVGFHREGGMVKEEGRIMTIHVCKPVRKYARMHVCMFVFTCTCMECRHIYTISVVMVRSDRT